MMLNLHNELIESSEFGSNHPRTLFLKTHSPKYQGQTPCKGKHFLECRTIQSRIYWTLSAVGSYVGCERNQIFDRWPYSGNNFQNVDFKLIIKKCNFPERLL